MVEALIWIQEVVGSNPILPTNVRMLELVDKIVLETIDCGRASASLATNTKWEYIPLRTRSGL